MGKLEAGFLKRFLHQPVDLLANRELLAGCGFVFDAHDHGRIVHLSDALGLDGAEQFFPEFGILHDLLVDLFLDELADLLEIRVERDPEVELGDDVIATEIRDRADVAKGDRVDHPARMAQPERPQADCRHRTLLLSGIHVVSHPERVVDQKEHPGDDVFDKRLGTETDGQADDTGAGDQRPDVHADGRQDDQ